MAITDSQIRDAAAKIDALLASEGVPIHARPLKSVTLIGKVLGVTGFAVLNEQPSVDFTRDNSHIWPVLHEWYEQRYGERLKFDMSAGRVAIPLRGATWSCEIPLMMGTIKVYVERVGLERIPMSPKERLGTLNVLDCIDGLTLALRSELTHDEMAMIGGLFQLGCAAFMTLSQSGKHELLLAARKDYMSAVGHLIDTPHNGQSRWSSLQAAEKVVKFQIAKHGHEYPKTHDLAKLSRLLASHGLRPLPQALIDAVQCDAGVRYASSASFEDALKAHHASLQVAALFAERPYFRRG